MNCFSNEQHHAQSNNKQNNEEYIMSYNESSISTLLEKAIKEAIQKEVKKAVRKEVKKAVKKEVKKALKKALENADKKDDGKKDTKKTERKPRVQANQVRSEPNAVHQAQMPPRNSVNMEISNALLKVAMNEPEEDIRRELFTNASDAISKLDWEVTNGYELAKGPKKIKGIGNGIAELINEYLETGKIIRYSKVVVQKTSIVNASNQGQKSAEERAAQRAKESAQIAKEAGLKAAQKSKEARMNAQKNSQLTWQDKWEQKRVKRTQVNGLSGYVGYVSSDDELLVDSHDDELLLDSDDELLVEPFEYKGKDYLIDAEDTVYDVNTSEPVGKYDRKNETLTIF